MADSLEDVIAEFMEKKKKAPKKRTGGRVLVFEGEASNRILDALGFTSDEGGDDDEGDEGDEGDDDDEGGSGRTKKKRRKINDKKPPTGHPFFREA